MRAKTTWLAQCNKTDAEGRYNISSEVLQEANLGAEEKNKTGSYISAIKINLGWKQPTKLQVFRSGNLEEPFRFCTLVFSCRRFAIHLKMAREGLQSIYNECQLISLLISCLSAVCTGVAVNKEVPCTWRCKDRPPWQINKLKVRHNLHSMAVKSCALFCVLCIE